MGLTPVMAHTGLQPYRTGPTPTPQTPMPTRQLPPQYSAPVPKYLLAQVTPKTPAQNRQPQTMATARNPLTMPQTTPGMGRNPFISPATGTNTIPIGTGTGQTNDPFANWDQSQPYPETVEGKTAYKMALQAWWNRNGFNGTPTAADMLQLMSGTPLAGSQECYKCRWNDCNDSRFPHIANMCPIMPKVPHQESNWHAYYTLRMRPPVTQTTEQPETQIQQVEEYTYGQDATMLDQGNGMEPPV